MNPAPHADRDHSEAPETIRAAARLCGDDGTVRSGAMHHGQDYACTGSAHFDGIPIECTNPVHADRDHSEAPETIRAAARLCGDDGTVRSGAMHHGQDYACTGSAHFDGIPIECTNPVHADRDHSEARHAPIRCLCDNCEDVFCVACSKPWPCATSEAPKAETTDRLDRYAEAENARLRDALRRRLGTPWPGKSEWWADVAALMNDRGDMWETENRPVLAFECRGLANAFRTYAEGVGVPSMDSLRRKRREAEAERDEVAGRLSALLCDLTGGRLSKPTYDVPTMVQEIEEHLTRQLEIDAEAERDRARSLAATLEAQLAQVEAQVSEWERLNGWPSNVAAPALRAILHPEESA